MTQLLASTGVALGDATVGTDMVLISVVCRSVKTIACLVPDLLLDNRPRVSFARNLCGPTAESRRAVFDESLSYLATRKPDKHFLWRTPFWPHEAINTRVAGYHKVVSRRREQ